MNPRRNYLCITLILLATGCAQQKVEEIVRSVEVTVLTADGPAAGAAIKVVDEQAAANALIALAGQADMNGSIPESQYGQFFQSLQPAGETEILSTDTAGKAVIKRLRGQHFVVAHSGQNLWLAAASDTRDQKLNLGPGSMGGKRALEVFSSQSAVSDALVAAARQALGKGQFDQARAFARASRSKTLAAEIDRAEAAALVKQAEQAMQEKNYEAAEKAAMRANALLPGQPETKTLLERVLTEYGGELRTMTGHKGAVTTVAYSPDGKFILSGSEDKTLKLWNAEDGKEVRTLTGHRGAVTGVAFGSTRDMAVSGSADGAVRLWDVATGQQLRTTEGLGWKIASVAVSPDGRRAASGADDNQVTLWELPKLERARALAGHGWRVTSVAFSAAGNRLLSGSEDDSVKLWDLATGLEVRSFRNNLAAVTCVAFSPDGRFGLSGGKDKVVKLWNLENGRAVQEFKGHSETLRSVTFSRDGRFAISAGDDGTIRLWDISAGKESRAFTGHTGSVSGVVVSPDGHFAVSAGADSTVKVWQLPRAVWPPQDEGQK
jgi:WD40 repeat protein